MVFLPGFPKLMSRTHIYNVASLDKDFKDHIEVVIRPFLPSNSPLCEEIFFLGLKMGHTNGQTVIVYD